jgi:hypothetical protein
MSDEKGSVMTNRPVSSGLCVCGAMPGQGPLNGCRRHFGRCVACSFRRGDRVQMVSGLWPEGRMLHGVVVEWRAGCGDIIEWDGHPELGTAMPNPNVRLDHRFVGELLDTPRCERCGKTREERDEVCS